MSELKGEPRTTISQMVVGDTVHLSVTGRIVSGPKSAGAVRAAVIGCSELRPQMIVLNIKAINKIDAAGLGALVCSYSTAESFGAALVLTNKTSYVEELLRLTKLDSIFGFAALFNRRYHPERGSYRNKILRTSFYEIFWPDVENGLDAFALRNAVARSEDFTNTEREDIIEDLALLFS